MPTTEPTLTDMTKNVRTIRELMERKMDAELGLVDDLPDDIDLDALLDTYEGEVGCLEDKLDSYREFLFELQGVIAGRKQRLEADQRALQAIRAKEDLVKTRMMDAVRATGENKVKTGRATYAIQNNGGALPMPVDEDNVPEDYCEILLRPDKKKIKAALDAGEKLDFAHFEPRGQHLRIR